MRKGSFGCGSMCAEGMSFGRGGLYGHFKEQGLPIGVQEGLEGFYRRCIDYLSRNFVPKWDSPNTESALATTGATYVLVELIDVAA